MPDDEKATPPVDGWVSANSAIRDAAKWILVTLGALGVALFGAAPALRGLQFSWKDPADSVQLGWAIFFCLLGLAGMVGLIIVVGRTLMPILVSFNRISPDTRAYFDAAEDTLLPVGTRSVRELSRQIRETRELIAAWEEQSSDSKPMADAIKAALTEAQERLVSLNAWASTVVKVEAYNRIRSSFFSPTGDPSLVPILVILAVVGSVGFTFALAKPPADESSSPATSAPQIGFLTPGSDEDASQLLWSNLELDTCQVDGRVAVLVLGEDDGKNTVQTIPRGPDPAGPTGAASCQVWEFDVIPETATLTLAVEAKPFPINYSPSPTPAP